MSDTASHKEYKAVDIFKLVCAALVVAIHVKPFESSFWLDAGVGLLTRFAVPYFFCASAYFLLVKLRRIENLSAKCRAVGAYALRLLRLYAVWYVIYAVISAVRGYIHSAPYYILQFFLPTNGSPLWFLPALIYGVAIVFLLGLILNDKAVFIISCAFLLSGYMLSTLGIMFENADPYIWLHNNVLSVIGTQNGLFFAFPYVALAMVCSGYEFTKKYGRDILGMASSFLLLAAESLAAVILVHSKLTFLWLSALPLTYFTFRLTLTLTVPLKLDYAAIRKMSTAVYVSHPLIMTLLGSLFAAAAIRDGTNLLLFVFTLVLSAAFSYGIVKLAGIRYFKWLKFAI